MDFWVIFFQVWLAVFLVLLTIGVRQHAARVEALVQGLALARKMEAQAMADRIARIQHDQLKNQSELLLALACARETIALSDTTITSDRVCKGHGPNGHAKG